MYRKPVSQPGPVRCYLLDPPKNCRSCYDSSGKFNRHESGIFRHQVTRSVVRFTPYTHLLIKDVQKTYAPGHCFLSTSMHGIRVGEEGLHRVAPQDGVVFTLTRVTPDLKENVEQGPAYVDGLTEE